MKRIYNIKILSLFWLLISLILMMSCEKNEDVNAGKVELLSFGPSGVRHGENIEFIGKNFDKVTSIALPGVEVAKSEFVSQNQELIELTVPEEATEGKVILKTTEGDIESKTALSFEVPVTIASVTPEARPGATITIKGDFMNWVEEVWFNQDLMVDEFESQSISELVVRVPMEAKTGKITLLTGGTKPLTIESENDLVVTLPSVSSLTPNSIKHSDNLTISGSDLDLATSIKFPGGSEISDFVSQSKSEIVVTIPDNAVDGSLTLVVPSLEEVVTTQEIQIILPVITDLSPSPVTPGDALTITGTDFDLIASITFPGGAVFSEFTSRSSTEIVVTVPDNAVNGSLKLTTIHDFEVTGQVPLVIPGDALAPLMAAIYEDALENGFGDWGYGGTTDVSNTELVRDGDKSAKKMFDGTWDAIRFSGSSISTSGASELVFSVYGDAGTDGLVMNLIINGNWGIKTFTIEEGKWVEFVFPLSDLGSPASIDDWGIQAQGSTGVIYVDHVGLR